MIKVKSLMKILFKLYSLIFVLNYFKNKFQVNHIVIIKIIIWPYHMVCGLLVGSLTRNQILKAQSLNHSTAREVPVLNYFNKGFYTHTHTHTYFHTFPHTHTHIHTHSLLGMNETCL